MTMAVYEDHWCARCEDTGWAYRDRGTSLICDAPPVGTHADYETLRCFCADRNPRIQARRAREAARRAAQGGRHA